ncbi:dihydrodipicolinate synthase family protein [Neorhodopirellula pilleata]|uniref:N-acetylneuraminate lyase n=1 Tax=Neorhodopirellula pilleata TaxID=2714738 RepID=A0A5C6AW38_9BACT|nr:dihydrodipicolinate synthase family protein [Neorhodopirellula pilleata]TWU03262.1 N-acetylneuraminate lyase [Neorhodopirellula pilleata]
MTTQKLSGLIAATYTPLDDQGHLNLSMIGPMVEHLFRVGIDGVYVCGSTGEGMSLSSEERRTVAEAYVQEIDKRVPVIIQVGHNSSREARQLAAHAQQIGADVISATCPSYYGINELSDLIDCMAEIAAGAPDLPFYYYHIPALTGSRIDVVEFLKRGCEEIPNLVGLKYTDTKLHEFQMCMETDQQRFDVVWGCDEMLLGALATGAQAAIGSTYNVAAPLYRRIIDAMNAGDQVEARRLQLCSITMVRVMSKYPFHTAMKAVLGMLGLPMGPCRPPQGRLALAEVEQLRAELTQIGFFDWCGTKTLESVPHTAET